MQVYHNLPQQIKKFQVSFTYDVQMSNLDENGLKTGIATSYVGRYVQVEKPPPAITALSRSTSSVALKSGDDPGNMLNNRWFAPPFQLE